VQGQGVTLEYKERLPRVFGFLEAARSGWPSVAALWETNPGASAALSPLTPVASARRKASHQEEIQLERVARRRWEWKLPATGGRGPMPRFQGSSADIIKLAMCSRSGAARLRAARPTVAAVLHDELVLERPRPPSTPFWPR